MPETSHFEWGQSWQRYLTGSFRLNEQIVSQAHKQLSLGIHLLFMRNGNRLDSSKTTLHNRDFFNLPRIVS